MNTFMDDVAASLVARYGSDLSGVDLVFATRRAERFFVIALSGLNVAARKPKFSTIDETMQAFSTLEKADNLAVVGDLYNIYAEFHSGETFDKFYSFGKLLLSDFDSVDKYLVDASKLYSIVSDTMDVENQFTDTTHQMAYDFWRSIERGRAEHHKEQTFFQVWQSLYDVYTRLGDVLAGRGEGYGGMIYRDAAKRVVDSDLSGARRKIFVGLNALSRSEKVVLGHLYKAGCADFIWDYDPRWSAEANNEAVYFIGENLKYFPQADYFLRSPSFAAAAVEVIATPSQVLQAKVAGDRLAGIAQAAGGGALDHRTAIVLTDENLIVPLLHSLPDCASSINVSVGYPLSSTAAYLFLRRLIDLQNSCMVDRGFDRQMVEAVVDHQFIANAEPLPDKIFYQPADLIALGDFAPVVFAFAGRSYQGLHNYLIRVFEFVAENLPPSDELQAYALGLIMAKIKQIGGVVANCGVDLSPMIYSSLLFESIAGERISYQGVSGTGVQIMGILESRSLDFDNVIILSLDDDNFPNAKNPSSYIPQNLRIAYGLPTVTDHSAIWSYYFYRLLQRASSVSLVYCQANSDKSSGEPSRYIYQLRHNPFFAVEECKVDMNIALEQTDTAIAVDKNAEMLASLVEREFSPSAINRYVNCPLAFYFADVEQIREEQQLENTLSSLDVGNVLHLSLYEIYKPYVGLSSSDVQRQLASVSQDQIKRVVGYMMREKCSVDTSSSAAALAALAIVRMASNVVQYDAHRSEPFSILELEKPLRCNVGQVRIKGQADRIDRMASGAIRVVDYKSGGDSPKCRTVEGLVSGAQTEHNPAVLQMLIYTMAAIVKYNSPAEVALYVARKMGAKDFDPTVLVDGSPVSGDVMASLQANLDALFSQMLSPLLPFAQSDNQPNSCTYCPYRSICRL